MAYVILILTTAALVVIALVAVMNVLLFRRLGAAPAHPARPVVSLLIPARNEAAVIGRTVQALLAQDYPALEVVMLDDLSEDGTGQAAQRAGAGDSRLRVIDGVALPAGWTGKNWACHQLGQAAQGDVLVFTDADVIWQVGALRALVDELAHTQADLLTVWPTQQTVTIGERLVVPLMGLAIYGYLPLPLVHHTRWAAFSAANGQCMAFRRQAYAMIGGHEAVRGQVVEDVALARRVKSNGLRLRMADGAGLIGCRMYRRWAEVRDGFAKNILAGHGNSVAALLLSTCFHWLIFVMPWVWLLAGWPDRAWALYLVALGVGTRMLSAAASRQRVLDGLLMPASVGLMTLIAARAVWWRVRSGGPRWKGRVIPQQADRAISG